jgi:uncharacterized protein YdaL
MMGGVLWTDARTLSASLQRELGLGFRFDFFGHDNTVWMALQVTLLLVLKNHDHVS